MRRLRTSHAVTLSCLLALTILSLEMAIAQTDSATVSGRVVDPSGFIVAGARVTLVDIDRETATIVSTNSSGLYTFRGVHPGRYRMEVAAKGFRVVNVTGLTVNTQANLEQNFALSVGSVSESITVEAKASEVSTSVSTVVDRQFVENLPLNGRSFQTLMQNTPGVVVTPTSTNDSGQFSVNGQRASANYFMVDGVSANIGATSNILATQNIAGAIPGFSVLGGTNNLVSVDALQEFRIQTSTYAPEFGRTPGAQVSIETRSGTNSFHGTLFDYLRNDVLDASNWFNGNVAPGSLPLRKSPERQSDFGGVFGGPIFKNKTFFFFSYEGQILRLPNTVISHVPSKEVRQDPSTPSVVLPFLNAFPLPNQPPDAFDIANQSGTFSSSFAEPSTLQASSLRIDHRVNDRLTVFGRFNYSPSALEARGRGGVFSLNTVTRLSINTETLTLGAIWSPRPNLNNDLRFNYSRNRATNVDRLDGFGGATVPAQSLFFPAPLTSKESSSALDIFLGGAIPAFLHVGPLTDSLQRQINVVEGFAIQRGQHALKLGVDYRRMAPSIVQPGYASFTQFFGIPSVVALSPVFVGVTANRPANLRFQNLGAYVQDTWKVVPRLTLTYGLRWDVDFTPVDTDGLEFVALSNVNDQSAIAVAPAGTPVFRTQYHNMAPRAGVSYQLVPSQRYATILRGGFGIFFDLATQQFGDVFSQGAYPFSASKFCSTFFSTPNCGTASLTFPLPADLAQAPPIVFDPQSNGVIGVNPSLDLPFTRQWNIAMEQSLGGRQMVSATYSGAVGRRLIQEEFFFPLPPSTLPHVGLIGNRATSDYHALQLQFQRQMSHGLQLLGSYTWSHSIDTASSGSATFGNLFARGVSASISRASSAFDVRHAFSSALTYAVPVPTSNTIVKKIAGGWSVDSMIQGRSATPVDVLDGIFAVLGSSETGIRPDVVLGEPFYLTGSACRNATGGACPGGKILNPKAFVDPPVDPTTFKVIRQGNLPRNALRGFGVFQWDSAVRRMFSVNESLRLEVRVEFFNVLNHPNFANPDGNFFSFSTGNFGRSLSTLNQGLSGDLLGGGGFHSLYQIGGPRSGQLAFKLHF